MLFHLKTGTELFDDEIFCVSGRPVFTLSSSQWYARKRGPASSQRFNKLWRLEKQHNGSIGPCPPEASWFASSRRRWTGWVDLDTFTGLDQIACCGITVSRRHVAKLNLCSFRLTSLCASIYITIPVLIYNWPALIPKESGLVTALQFCDLSSNRLSGLLRITSDVQGEFFKTAAIVCFNPNTGSFWIQING